MRWVRLLLLLFTLLFLTVRDPGGLIELGVAPHWLLALALLAGITASPGWAAFIGWSAGIFVDAFSLEPLGLHAFCFGAAAVLLSRIRRTFFAEHPVTQGGLAFAISLLVMLVLLIRLEIAEPPFLFLATFPGVVFTALVTAVALPLLVAIDRQLGLLRGFREREQRV